MEQDTKELKFKLKVLEKLLVLGVDEKELSNMGALDFWAIYRTSKFSEREGDMLIELAEAIGKKQLYSFLLKSAETTSAPTQANGGDLGE